jgi:eukaryotic-like serine/threonine-protein kinase
MVQRAEKYAAERSRWRGGDPLWNSAQLPLLRAGIEYGRGQSAKAVDLLQPVRAYERAFPFAIYLRGLAYLRLNKGAEGTAEFQRIIDHRGANWGPVYPLSYVGLARASKIVGDVGRALKADRDFLTLWKDADENINVLTKVRQEYAATN